MRHLIILRGPEFSGKKSFVKAHGLTPWLVDQATLEAIFAEPVSDPSGGCRQDPHSRQRLRRRILSVIEEKMSRGALIVFQPTDTGAPYARTTASASDKLIACILTMAKTHRYDTQIVDFAQDCDPKVLHQRRIKVGVESRQEEVERVVRHMNRKVGIPDDQDVAWKRPQDIDSLLASIEPQSIDLSQWNNIVAIGDIHGCSKTLSQLTDGFEVRPDTAYIMLGDYINKGPDSGGVLRALLEKFMPHQNCYFLTGNHERALSDWQRGADSNKKAFYTTGLPSIEACGLTREDTKAFLDRTLDAAWFHWRGIDILATHGGFARPPERLAPLSAEHFQLGTDTASFDVDAAWEANVRDGVIPGPSKLIQIHGHRNPNGRPIAASMGSFCLEESVDQGGPLRALAISPDGSGYAAREIYIKNKDMLEISPTGKNSPKIGAVSV
jgi:predicted kinase